MGRIWEPLRDPEARWELAFWAMVFPGSLAVGRLGDLLFPGRGTAAAVAYLMALAMVERAGGPAAGIGAGAMFVAFLPAWAAARALWGAAAVAAMGRAGEWVLAGAAVGVVLLPWAAVRLLGPALRRRRAGEREEEENLPSGGGHEAGSHIQ